MKSLILDANVLVRFLVQDEPKQVAAAAKLMAEAQKVVCELLLDPMIVAETVYVLTSTYKRSRVDVANLLLTIIRSPSIQADPEDDLTIKRCRSAPRKGRCARRMRSSFCLST